jgi:hypothetical protein
MQLRPYQSQLVADTRINEGGYLMKYKHGLCYNNIYRRWINMRSRCNNPKSTKFYLYGGKGIKVCDEWQNNFIAFYNWSIENGYNSKLTLDRIDGNKDYSATNCRWATFKEQSRNTTQTHFLAYENNTMCIEDWAIFLDIDSKMLRERIRRGWSIKRALTTPNTKKSGFNFGEYVIAFKRGDYTQ